MGGIINKQKLDSLREEIEGLRARKNNIKPADLVSLAKALGRVPKKRGKHPTYVQTLISRNPLSIPGHPTIKSGTALGILDELEADIDGLSALLDQQQERGHEH